MKLGLIIAAMMLGLAMPAAADYATTEEAYEVRLSDIRLPRGPTGTIGFKACSTCNVLTKRIDGNTRWLIDGKAVKLQEFREATDRVADRDTEAVTVIHNLENDRVTAVSVYL